MTALPDVAFHPADGWVLHPSVAVRPEPFGALLYHFGTRRLTFVKDPRLLAVVQGLADHPCPLDAYEAAHVPSTDVATYTAALQRLVDTQMLVPTGSRAAT
jgi:mycofactocin biosynthesis protein MftB